MEKIDSMNTNATDKKNPVDSMRLTLLQRIEHIKKAKDDTETINTLMQQIDKQLKNCVELNRNAIKRVGAKDFKATEEFETRSAQMAGMTHQKIALYDSLRKLTIELYYYEFSNAGNKIERISSD